MKGRAVLKVLVSNKYNKNNNRSDSNGSNNNTWLCLATRAKLSQLPEASIALPI
jgi:hypothetical protein